VTATGRRQPVRFGVQKLGATVTDTTEPSPVLGGVKSEQAQTQSQSVSQAVHISVNSSGDMALEDRIFRDVHSAGRQLARLSTAMCVVIERLGLDPELTPVADANRALTEFRQMRSDIQAEIKARDDRLVASLQQIRDTDPARYAALAPRLRQLLGAAPNGDR